ncbi:SET domain-containing protein-lysine N-methyltransferase [Chlorogloeopsis sp. ULAP01]|uniref:SET domain-containing protein-lysine N-methyltransferase n=1 Tax=Chlorogloeopsis sp. ULAP01 TaxID=3056483 RepID=UPI0025AB305A|nr:SET domain-containing protein-lysine N-methyltransferase [Chlorogloeopsis sp. ULAP01]MDM9382649.1 SET domain-containing protein-lysine N-methyltransferase [Chlorogloeopsis sp. ULAP01]
MVQQILEYYKFVGNQDCDRKTVANVAIKKGQVIKNINFVFSLQNFLTVQVDFNQHILDELLAAMNHSCSPTSFVDLTNKQIIAERDIAVGEEITFFYPSTEWRMVRPFQCRCGSPKCITTISGAEDLPISLLKNYRINSHIKQSILKTLNISA